MTSGPSIALTSPPATAHPGGRRRTAKTSLDLENVREGRAGWRAQRRRHHTGVAPIPARSESATAIARAPRRRGLIHERRKSDSLHQGVLADCKVTSSSGRPDSGIVTRADCETRRYAPGDLGERTQQGTLARVRQGRPPLVERRIGGAVGFQRHTSAIYGACRGGTVGGDVRLALGLPGSLWCAGDVPTDAWFGHQRQTIKEDAYFDVEPEGGPDRSRCHHPSGHRTRSYPEQSG